MALCVDVHHQTLDYEELHVADVQHNQHNADVLQDLGFRTPWLLGV
jgi:hypothetical protein